MAMIAKEKPIAMDNLHEAGRRMGFGVWAKAMQDKQTPQDLLEELYWFEALRLQTNMQISCLTFIAKQARECQEKMDEALEVLAQAKHDKAEKL